MNTSRDWLKVERLKGRMGTKVERNKKVLSLIRKGQKIRWELVCFPVNVSRDCDRPKMV
jgi:hypothetical protein